MFVGSTIASSRALQVDCSSKRFWDKLTNSATTHFFKALYLGTSLSEAARRDGTLKKDFTGKNVQHNLRNERASRKQNASYTQLSAKIAKLETSNKKLMRAKKKRPTPIHPEVMGPVALGN